MLFLLWKYYRFCYYPIKLNMTLKSWQSYLSEAWHHHLPLFLSEKMTDIAKDFRTWWQDLLSFIAVGRFTSGILVDVCCIFWSRSLAGAAFALPDTIGDMGEIVWYRCEKQPSLSLCSIIIVTNWGCKCTKPRNLFNFYCTVQLGLYFLHISKPLP